MAEQLLVFGLSGQESGWQHGSLAAWRIAACGGWVMPGSLFSLGVAHGRPGPGLWGFWALWQRAMGYLHSAFSPPTSPEDNVHSGWHLINLLVSVPGYL